MANLWLVALASVALLSIESGATLADTSTPQVSYEVKGKAAFCDVTVIYGPNDRGASSSAPGGRAAILYDPDVMANLPYLDAFVFAHECGHHALNHTSMVGLLREGHLFEMKELAADCWGAKALVAAGQDHVLRQQLEIFRSMPGERPGPRYPSFGKRADQIENCAYGDGEVVTDLY